MGSRFTITPPGDYLLTRDVCSYGYFLLAPNRWSPSARTLDRTLLLGDSPAKLTIAQPGDTPGAPLAVISDRPLSRPEKADASRQIARMLRLDDDVAEFHRVDPRWRASGRGRLFRSPTFFEDVVKTVTSCNVTWPGTVNMNRRLCEVVSPAFPSPGQLARKRPSMLRARCGVGYRDVRIVQLAKLFVTGKVSAEWFEDPARTDEEIHDALLELPGVGPYAAGNILHLLGRCAFLAIDTESHRHAKNNLGLSGSPAEIERALRARYEPFGRHRFRSYWFELMADYEARNGPAWTWDPDRVGASFTASKLKSEPPSPGRPAPAKRPTRRRAG